MERSTDYYVKLHSSYLSNLSAEKRVEELEKYDTIYDHMYSFLLGLELTLEKAVAVIDDFRSDMMIAGVRDSVVK